MRFTTHSIDLSKTGMFGDITGPTFGDRSSSPEPIVPDTDGYAQKNNDARIQNMSDEDLANEIDNTQEFLDQARATNNAKQIDFYKNILAKLQHEMNQRKIGLQIDNRLGDMGI